MISWKYDGSDCIEDFGYMWECPDVFDVGGHRYLSVSPQGLRHGETKFQNVYQSGYFRYDGSLNGFTEWDYGFDFYAPQTFEAPDGRRIIRGGMGIGDIPYTNPTIALGYQHCLTVPREITADENGVLMQNPIRELSELRGAKKSVSDCDEVNMELPSEIIAKVGGEFSIEIKDVLTLSWEDGIFDRLVSGEMAGEEPAQSRTGCRIWQLKKDVDVAMRFIGYEDQVRKFGEPDAENYTLVFDGDLGTSDLERIYTICRDAPPPGYQGYRMALSDVVELYDDSGSEFYYCDRVGFQPIRFEQKQEPCINMTL